MLRTFPRPHLRSRLRPRDGRRLAVVTLACLLLFAGLEVAADASASPQRAQAPQASDARVAATRGTAPPRLYGQGIPGGVQFTWPRMKGAVRYRVAWSAAPFGKWPTRSYVTGWLPKTARSATLGVPGVAQPGDHMLGVAYAHPVFGRLLTKNRRGRVRQSAGWLPVFPAPPNPGTGDALRIGTYNVLGAPAGARANAIAANINEHGLGVVAFQEATTSTAQAVVSALGPEWAYVSYASSPEQILYRKTVYRVLNSGVFNVYDAKTPGTPLPTPWARFALVNPNPGSRAFLVASTHVTEDAAKSVMDRKADSGREAIDMMNGVNAANGAGSPVIIAGDLHDLRTPFGDVPGHVEAAPTLVRGGYYDAMAALSKTNITYRTFNGGNGITAAPLTPAPSGTASRTDYIMLRGFRGSAAYVNVANWSWNGIVPSDHNLVYADVVVPFA